MLTMERGLSIVLASAILLGGIIVAQMFRRHMPSSAPEFADSPDTLFVRRQLDRWAPQAEARRRAGQREAMRREMPSPTILTPLADQQPPPSLPPNFPRPDASASSRWGTPMGLDLPDASLARRSHVIVDGDTLAALAQRYLGRADRALELYEANRDVLPEPDILPIGARLQIPPPEARRLPSEQKTDRPLVPVAPRNG